ncbi:7848_t:CDS:2 [Ambispora gerdemannii]|uniref:7848_t:CDS:1 n=1 Tax=Ambispora gerdemannii TaxID=144530 RepID=A0A9N9FGW9_9GLOM|nr:7848_t:CDS:2 [Ambispora gerdemannii]
MTNEASSSSPNNRKRTKTNSEASRQYRQKLKIEKSNLKETLKQKDEEDKETKAELNNCKQVLKFKEIEINKLNEAIVNLKEENKNLKQTLTFKDKEIKESHEKEILSKNETISILVSKNEEITRILASKHEEIKQILLAKNEEILLSKNKGTKISLEDLSHNTDTNTYSSSVSLDTITPNPTLSLNTSHDELNIFYPSYEVGHNSIQISDNPFP